MSSSYTTVALTISTAILSGAGATMISNIRDKKKEEIRKQERYQDSLKMEVKDLKIQLYQLERDLVEWKDKYYNTIQELISVKAELEDALIKINNITCEE